jgi:plastocyanin
MPRMSDRLFPQAGLLLGALLLLGSATALAQEGETVVISDGLGPADLEVSAGTTVTWRNDDGERHRMRSRSGPAEFDTGNLEPGETYTFTFVVEGTYPYLDERNDEDPAYVGSVVVGPAEAVEGPLPTSATVTIVDEAFHPPMLEVATGATVEWAHVDGDEEHTVTSSDGLFNSGIMVGGQTFTQTFDSPGTFSYFCGIHPEMLGTITVSGPDLAPVAVPVASEPALEEPADAAADPLSTTAGEVSIIDFSFQPATIEVAIGSTVTWTNDDSVDHTVTATEGSFNSGVMGAGDAFAQTFDTPGTFEYFCAIHPSMQGAIIVSEADEATVTEAAPAEGG